MRLGRTVIAVRHADVREMLGRDLDFLIGPVNAAKIDSVNGRFVLGLDRSPLLAKEREALYSALAAVDCGALGQRLRTRASEKRLALGSRFDAIRLFIRPLTAGTAMDLFGIQPDDEPLFADVARAIFAHTFLNQTNDKKIAARALAAAPLMKSWFETEIRRRRSTDEIGDDLMGQLLRQGRLDDDGVRRTLGGMLVGSIDTTTSAVAKILCVVDSDGVLREAMQCRLRDEQDIYGLCQDALRLWPHNPVILRRAAVDTKLGKTKVRAEDRVVGWTEAAMLDAEAFPEPRTMVPDRPNDAYLHFGGGLHPCAGRVMNSIQIPILVGSLLDIGSVRAGRLGWAGSFPDRLPMRRKVTS